MGIDQLLIARPGDRAGDDALEVFISERIFGGSHAGDGMGLTRVIDLSEVRARIVGRMWLIDPMREAMFWVEIETTSALALRWRICFELLAIGGNRRPRDVENAIFVLNDVDQGEWRFDVSGVGVAAGADIVSVVETSRSETV